MELVSELKKRINKAHFAMVNSEYPEEFKDILSKSVECDGKTVKLSELLDTNPFKIVLLIQRDGADFGEFTREFGIYARDMTALRNNHYCNTGESWKEFTKRKHTASDYTFGDNYSKHEMM